MNDLIFEAEKRKRLMHRFCGITVVDGGHLWWSCAERKWVASPARGKGAMSSHAPCRTVKAFRRHIRKHVEELQGHRVTLCSRWIGHDVHCDVRSSPTRDLAMSDPNLE